ncbi:hypothetical protein [Bacillus smithii]|uniref:hypothetical protein n=1 Tax=Bacillus smithii TaxID=1479 RepID=UPI003D1DA34C
MKVRLNNNFMMCKKRINLNVKNIYKDDNMKKVIGYYVDKKGNFSFLHHEDKKGYLKEVPDEIVSRFDDSGYNIEEVSLKEIVDECKYVLDCFDDLYEMDIEEQPKYARTLKTTIKRFYEKYKDTPIK